MTNIFIEIRVSNLIVSSYVLVTKISLYRVAYMLFNRFNIDIFIITVDFMICQII